jgi:hypothetical protein
MKAMAGRPSDFRVYLVAKTKVCAFRCVVYITALLRSTQYLSLPQVRAFVSLEPDSLPPSVHTLVIGKQGIQVPQSQIQSSDTEDAVGSPMLPLDDTIGSTAVQSTMDMRASIYGLPANSNSTDDTSFFQDSTGHTHTQGSMQSALKTADSLDQGKWRKVFMNMRMKLKPHEIAVSTWLISLQAPIMIPWGGPFCE